MTAGPCSRARTAASLRPQCIRMQNSVKVAARTQIEPKRKSGRDGHDEIAPIQYIRDVFRRHWRGMAAERIQRRRAAVLAADVVGYSRFMEQDDAVTFGAA